MPFFVFLFLVLVSVSPNLTFSIVADHATPTRKLGSSSSSSSLCPLDIDGFRKIIHESNLRLVFLDVQTECHYMFQAIRLLHSQYLQTTGYFFPPPAASDACWVAYEGLVDELLPGFRVRSTCGFKDSLMWESCLNITTRSQFEKLISQSDLQKIWSSCNQSLSNSSFCSSCLDSLSTVSESYFRGVNDGNASDCTGYPSIYAAAVANPYGPTNFDTAKCLFSIDLFPTHKKKKKHVVFRAVVTGSVCGFIGAIGVVWIFWRRHRKMKKKNMVENEMGFTPKRDFIGGNTKLFKLTFQEIKKSTNNFSRENIIGMGGYGNVYRGILPDGSEVAFKRFKNCSVAADKTFAHEVEVIASIRHVNLVALRGYCTETVPLEGHQRIIVCDLVHNRSLYDHLFGSGAEKKKLSWPTRQKIALVIEFKGVNTLLLTDWAWSLVKQGKVLDIIDGGMPELGLQDEMEKYVLAALVSAHPIVQARPTMDQIVKILEANFPVPPIPDRPFSLLESIADTEQSIGFNNLNYFPSPEPFICNSDHPILDQYGNGRRLK
ncbi:hypothetical protein FEM48_Zijuj02G0152700 [Ziziphus jujuba var. spinosa]|uniref:Protein kinase domain-containing protein n=1 Tax=Ziziphus jujuba var. spinosa TaxID=714518 RepID=A0A978VWF5_ZIZJJ|nr:hypothetical protein FEM48_Zijuj02G0152700 [Ziziphus jujuba var. spinosa]